MKRIVVTEPFQVRIESADVPELNPDEVLMEVKAGGLCGSDLHSYQGKNPNITYPQIPGHEVVGVIVERGTSVRRRSCGERVAVEPVRDECGQCYCCRRGFPHCCPRHKFIGAHLEGGLQQFIKAPEDKVYPIPDELAFTAAVLSEPT